MVTSRVTLFIFTLQYLLYVYVHVDITLDLLRLNLFICALRFLVISYSSSPGAFYLLALNVFNVLYGNVISIHI